MSAKLKPVQRPSAESVLMEHTHRVYELDAILDQLEDLTSPLEPTPEQARRVNALAGLAARIAKDEVAVCDALMETEIAWRGGAR